MWEADSEPEKQWEEEKVELKVKSKRLKKTGLWTDEMLVKVNKNILNSLNARNISLNQK